MIFLGLMPQQLSNHDIETMISGTKLHMQVNGIGTALLKKGNYCSLKAHVSDFFNLFDIELNEI